MAWASVELEWRVCATEASSLRPSAEVATIGAPRKLPQGLLHLGNREPGTGYLGESGKNIHSLAIVRPRVTRCS